MPTVMRSAALIAIQIGFYMWGYPPRFVEATSKKSTSKIVCESQGSPSGSCAEGEFRKNGKPMMLPSANGVAFGVSSAPADPANVFVWMDNQTDEAQTYGMMCNVSFQNAFLLYNSAGNRLLTKGEQRSLQSDHPNDLHLDLECSCCIVLTIAPHTMEVVDRGNLIDVYSLAPGNYFLLPVNPRTRRNVLSSDAKVDKVSYSKNSIKIVIPRRQN